MFFPRAAYLVAMVGVLAGCVPEPVAEPERPRPDDTLIEVPVTPEPEPISRRALETMAEILEITHANSLTRFARFADGEEGFASNFAGSGHYEHWSLIRRTGVDPLRKIEALFQEPHAVKTVGDETWYIWPDLAAKSPEELVPERLSFRDRARLEAFIGETGIEKIRAGGAYPGFRTAISRDGRWVYFLHETGEGEYDE